MTVMMKRKCTGEEKELIEELETSLLAGNSYVRCGVHTLQLAILHEGHLTGLQGA